MAFDEEMKKCLYRCTNCSTEWHKWLPAIERKTRRWCPQKCGILVTPYKTERKLSTDHKVKTTVPKRYY